MKILRNGELEDYITEATEQYLQEQRVSGKELSILKLVESIVYENRDVEEFFEIKEFRELIQLTVG